MGEAKRRGTFEERKNAAIKRLAKVKRQQSLISEQHQVTGQRTSNSANLLATMLGITAAFSINHKSESNCDGVNLIANNSI